MQSIEKELDKLFSQYIKNRGAVNGLNTCIICGKQYGIRYNDYNRIECGHFIPRKYKLTRWDIRNAAPQCFSCNRNMGTQTVRKLFEYHIIEKYGREVLIYLKQSIKQLFIPTQEFYEHKLKELNAKLREL